MNKKTKFSIIFISTFFVLIVVAFIFATRWTSEYQKFLETKGSVEYAKVHDVVITETKNGEKDWEIYAAVADYDNRKVQASMTDIVGNYYKNGEVIMSFTSPTGTYNSETKKVVLNDTKVVGKENVEVTANEMSWVTTEEKIHAQGNVVINKANEMIALAKKATLTTDLKNVELIDSSEVRVYRSNY